MITFWLYNVHIPLKYFRIGIEKQSLNILIKIKDIKTERNKGTKKNELFS